MMSGPPPPPPPPGPAPPPPVSVSKKEQQGKTKLLNDIHKGTKLKSTKHLMNDRSVPLVSSKAVPEKVPNKFATVSGAKDFSKCNGTSQRNETVGPSASAVGARASVNFADLFAGGIPKLRPRSSSDSVPAIIGENTSHVSSPRNLPRKPVPNGINRTEDSDHSSSTPPSRPVSSYRPPILTSKPHIPSSSFNTMSHSRTEPKADVSNPSFDRKSTVEVQLRTKPLPPPVPSPSLKPKLPSSSLAPSPAPKPQLPSSKPVLNRQRSNGDVPNLSPKFENRLSTIILKQTSSGPPSRPLSEFVMIDHPSPPPSPAATHKNETSVTNPSRLHSTKVRYSKSVNFDKPLPLRPAVPAPAMPPQSSIPTAVVPPQPPSRVVHNHTPVQSPVSRPLPEPPRIPPAHSRMSFVEVERSTVERKSSHHSHPESTNSTHAYSYDTNATHAYSYDTEFEKQFPFPSERNFPIPEPFQPYRKMYPSKNSKNPVNRKSSSTRSSRQYNVNAIHTCV